VDAIRRESAAKTPTFIPAADVLIGDGSTGPDFHRATVLPLRAGVEGGGADPVFHGNGQA
jgi:hypothetical protein